MKPLLIGLAGRAGAGKDTVGRIIKEHLMQKGYGVKRIAFADPLKKICQQVYAFTDDQMLIHELKVAPDSRYPRLDGTFLTPRESMQMLGSEWARKCYPNTWVDFGMRMAKQMMDSGLSVVITDTRFFNEATAILEADGEVWRIKRPSSDEVSAVHTSETEMDSPEFCKIVSRAVINDGSLDLLKKSVLARLP